MVRSRRLLIGVVCSLVVLLITAGVTLVIIHGQPVTTKQRLATPAASSAASFSPSDIKRLEQALGSNDSTTQASVMLPDLGKLFMQNPKALPKEAAWQFLPATLQVKDASARIEATAPVNGQQTTFVVHLDFSSSQWLISGITKK